MWTDCVAAIVTELATLRDLKDSVICSFIFPNSVADNFPTSFAYTSQYKHILKL